MKDLTRWLDTKMKIKELEDQIKALKTGLARQEELAVEEMIAAEMPSAKISGMTVFFYKQIWASYPTEPEALDVLRTNGLAAFIKPSVNSSTFSSYVREQSELGLELPEAVLEFASIETRVELRTRKS